MKCCTWMLALSFTGLIGTAASAIEDRKNEKQAVVKEPATDQEFVAKAVSCAMAEVKFAELASKNAKDEQVAKFAATMYADHAKLRDSLLVKAKEMKIAVGEGLEKHHQDQWQKLTNLKGMDFDLEYLRCVIDNHEKGAEIAKKWAKNGTDSGVRSLAEESGRVMNLHLETARKLYKPLSK